MTSAKIRSRIAPTTEFSAKQNMEDESDEEKETLDISNLDSEAFGYEKRLAKSKKVTRTVSWQLSPMVRVFPKLSKAKKETKMTVVSQRILSGTVDSMSVRK